MQIKQLTYLAALAREQHFGRAAAACHVSQPTLSAGIRQLEDDLGVPVVERGRRFNGLTPEGRRVLDHATRILAECEALRQNLDEASQGLSGRLRLGVVPTALPMVSHVTVPMYARYPKVMLTILSQSSIEIQRGIENFELEAGITYLDNEPLEHVRARPLYAENYVFLTAAKGAFGGRKNISWKDAADAPLCLLTPDMQNRRILDGVFRSVGASPTPVMETNSILNLCSHASAGHWSSIVPAPLLRVFGLPKGTVALPLVTPEVTRSVGLIIAAREPASPLARSLFELDFGKPDAKPEVLS
jgi:DNA-binding transcriptional LysR family regulator